MQKVNTTDFVRYLKENWKDTHCQLCGGGDWKIQAAVFQLILNDENMVAGNANVPVVPVICTKCGNTVLISAKIAGLVE
jgi:hypothetical protein